MSSKSLILMTINTSWNIVNFRSSLLKRLADEGYALHTAAPDDEHTGALAALVDVHHPIAMQNDGTSLRHDALLFWRYLRLLRKLRPSVVLAYTIKPNIYATLAAACLGIPVINNVSGLGTVFIKHNWLTRVAKGLYRLAFTFSSRVFFQNADDQALFVSQRLVDAKRTRVIAGSGIDLEAFTPRAGPSSSAGACQFVLIARLLRDKGIGEYVEAARLLKKQHPQYHFRLVGQLGVANKTAITAAQIAAWQAEGIIEYLGASDDVRSVIASHDAVVLPSYREGLSRVLLEGAAMGKPLVTTNVAGCRDVVTEGENGLLCEVKNAASLADAMHQFAQLSEEQKTEMGQASRKRAEEFFDEKYVHEAYLSAIRECAR